MNLFLNIAFLAVTALFMGAYVVNLVINLIRAFKVNKLLKQNPLKTKGKVVDIIKDKKRVYVRVKYSSPANFEPFEGLFEFTENEFKDQYYINQEVEIVYPDISSMKRLVCFPVYLDGMKLKVEIGPIVTDCLLLAAGIYIFANTLFQMITKNAFSGNVPLYTSMVDGVEVKGSLTILYVILILVMYVMLFSYVMERLTSASLDHNQNYLKLCGIKGTAQVKTFKFGRSKNAKGIKESQMKIEFYSNTGEKIEANLNSYLYTDTQEEFINILYDPKNPRNVAYMRSENGKI